MLMEFGMELTCLFDVASNPVRVTTSYNLKLITINGLKQNF